MKLLWYNTPSGHTTKKLCAFFSTYVKEVCFMTLLLAAFFQYTIYFIFLCSVAVGGIFLGKKLRDNKDSKADKAKA